MGEEFNRNITNLKEKNTQPIFGSSSNNYDEYISAMKRIHRRSIAKKLSLEELPSPRERRRRKESLKPNSFKGKPAGSTSQDALRVSIIASMVPDEIIYSYSNYSIRSYETALMFIDVSGFTDLCEKYTKIGSGGPSRLTQVLNSYIGAMVQEILTHNGDVLKFSGDAFLCMWKKKSKMTMQQVVHAAIDCGIIIQKNYGTYITDVGIVLKVKVAISAGLSHFSIIDDGNKSHSHYVIVGQPVWDVKRAQYMTTAGDVLTSASAWTYVNETEYCTEPCDDGMHTKVLGVGATWKRVEKLDSTLSLIKDDITSIESALHSEDGDYQPIINYREFSLRPAVIRAMRSEWWPALRPFMVPPVLRAVDNDEFMDFLAEVRRVVVVFVNIITNYVTDEVLVQVVNDSYKRVCNVTSASGGLVNKVSMFDKDMMFLVVFGLRGLKHEDEAQKALQCAYELKHSLKNPNIISVSIGVTSGKTYCGVVGHVLRREYTVIGSAVNKAARLMTTYLNKVTCDKETFLRSKLEQEHFQLMAVKYLKGFGKPGPIYEFNKDGWSERQAHWRHPIIGRDGELQKYKMVLENALKQQHQKFTKYRDHKYAIVYLGPKLIGKSRLIEECIYITPNFIRVEKIHLKEDDMLPFRFIRLLLSHSMAKSNTLVSRDSIECSIRRSFDLSTMDSKHINAFNVVFGCRLPMSDKIDLNSNIFSDFRVKKLIQDFFKQQFTSLCVIAVEDAHYIDDESWLLILYLLETKCLFFLMGVDDGRTLSPTASQCLKNGMIVIMHLTGIDRCYHAALACQLLDVQAIPADLEKVIQSASGGQPGWIQNFVISLVQLGELTVVTIPRNEAVESGAVVPCTELMVLRNDNESRIQNCFQESMVSVEIKSSYYQKEGVLIDSEKDLIQMAVLSETYNFENMKVDMTMDAIILKTYDSLTPFEKMLLKCGSVLGDVFSRRMLRHLLQSNSSRSVALAVAKLFTIRVLECEGGDFTRDCSLVLIHPAPAQHDARTPYCACLGTRQPPDCRDLPTYAFCGFMKFKNSSFRTTMYDLLTDAQKGLAHKSKKMKQTEERIRALNAETLIDGEQFIPPFDFEPDYDLIQSSIAARHWSGTSKTEISPIMDKFSLSVTNITKESRIRSFTSLQSNCECLYILTSVYCQIIDHCRGAGETEKLFEAYLEYADLSMIGLNIPQAIRLLFEVENLVASKMFEDKVNNIKWIKKYRLARIYSLRGACMLDSGDFTEARKQLYRAMELYCDPFPTSTHKLRFRNLQELCHQMMALYLLPNKYIATESGFVGNFFEEIARTLNLLYKLFTECKEIANASLAAKWSLNYALKTNSNFRVLCVSYGNMIVTYKLAQNFSRCVNLEKRAMDLCRRKCGQVDLTEVLAVCYLYASIFLFYVEYGKKMESLEFGVSVMHMITNLTDLTTKEMLILSMLKLLLADCRLNDMVLIMREFFYMDDHYDLSAETWYYNFATVILLDTGYYVESYASSEKFYIKRGDALLRSKTPESAWNFFVCMWLITIRIGAWERSILWEDKIQRIILMKFKIHEFTVMILVRLIEGILITLVREIDNRNEKKIVLLHKILKPMFQDLKKCYHLFPIYRPRSCLLSAYYHLLKGKKYSAYKILNKAHILAKKFEHCTVTAWIEHTRNHWKGTLNPALENYWVDHVESENIQYYKDFDKDKSTIIPYTLPLPRDLEK